MGVVLELGAFFISPAVKDRKRSRGFYEKFGFAKFGGDAAQSWLIFKKGGARHRTVLGDV